MTYSAFLQPKLFCASAFFDHVQSPPLTNFCSKVNRFSLAFQKKKYLHQNNKQTDTMTATHLIAPATLPKLSQTHLSVLSYNILLPNSIDAWWTYKMYSPVLDDQSKHIASWKYRQNLLRDRISLVDADIVCLQEVCPESFHEDFQFMQELGYDGVELFKKGRFRPATFWKTMRCTLVTPPAHKDRTLLTAFRPIDQDPNVDTQSWFVLNCHLQAGNEGKRRLRQMHEGTKAIITMANKLKEKDPKFKARVIVCGDFNGGAECAAVRFIEDGLVTNDFVEDGVPVTPKTIELPFSSALKDAVKSVDRDPPSTMIVPELISLLVDKHSSPENPKLSQEMIQRLEIIYNSFASQHYSDKNAALGPGKVMNISDVERWLFLINGELGRGDEYREAAKQMGWTPPPEIDLENTSNDELKKLICLPQDTFLSLQGFFNVYQRELERGKFWGIAHDMAILGHPLPDAGVFTSRFDRMYCSASLDTAAVIDTLCDKACPNDSEPSDHLPVAATFVLHQV